MALSRFHKIRRIGAGCARAAALLVPLCGSLPPARGEDAQTLFDEAAKRDLNGGGAQAAFALFRRAAEAGLPEAELNVAVMLDSGRGTPPDVTMAATWYARAAARGLSRAAYNLGQLYAIGHGVPRNLDLARAWFGVSGLQASGDRIAALRPPPNFAAGGAVRRPVPMVPEAGKEVRPVRGGIEFVWTSEQQPKPVRFIVELRILEGAGSREVFWTASDVSSVLAPLSVTHGAFAWRVIAASRDTEDYVASGWQRFTLAPNPASQGPALIGQAKP